MKQLLLLLVAFTAINTTAKAQSSKNCPVYIPTDSSSNLPQMWADVLHNTKANVDITESLQKNLGQMSVHYKSQDLVEYSKSLRLSASNEEDLLKKISESPEFIVTNYVMEKDWKVKGNWYSQRRSGVKLNTVVILQKQANCGSASRAFQGEVVSFCNYKVTDVFYDSGYEEKQLYKKDFTNCHKSLSEFAMPLEFECPLKLVKTERRSLKNASYENLQILSSRLQELKYRCH